MKSGQFNILLDASHGSSGKGLMSTYLADRFKIRYVSSSNFPNAGHTCVFEGKKFVAKAIPTACALKKFKGLGINGFISPGSGFDLNQLFKEWKECDKPKLFIHDRASIVTSDHKLRESDGPDATKHIASTMQGTGAALADKILRKANCLLAKDIKDMDPLVLHGCTRAEFNEFEESVKVLPAIEFRNLTHALLSETNTWLHEGSQGYALSIDHGNEYPYCTSRNCTAQAAMDQMAIPHQKVGDIYLNLRTYPIRVGNVVEDGKQVGYSGSFYSDSEEISWEEVARRANMPNEEATRLAERERTTVTKRIRRVSTFSWIGLKDAVRVNGATKLCVNFIQYLNWKDAGIQGGKEALQKLSAESRKFIDKVEETARVPVVLIGTGAEHHQVIDLL